MKNNLLFRIGLAILLTASAASAGESRFSAPTSQKELDARLAVLRHEYAPYLRTLPEKLPGRERTVLPAEWKFTYEVKDPPKRFTPPPPAPSWFATDFDDRSWEVTTVPEWRYRTVGHDNVYNRTVDKAVITGDRRNTSQICWYRCRFTAEEPVGDRRLWLCFDGVDWEAQVYLNGVLLGHHRGYHEPFRFDITSKVVNGENALAVRVIDGLAYGEPLWAWSIFPDIRAERQRYTPRRADSIQGHLPIGYHCGTGFGIWREVCLEETGPVRIDTVFVRNDLSDGKARVKVELDGKPADVRVDVLPENFEGRSYTATSTTPTLEISMPDAKVWTPETPNLYHSHPIRG
jgi:beta-galactosidase/beta-glucuronidase